MKFVKVAILFLFILSFVLLAFSVTVFLGKRAEEMRRIQVEGELDVQKAENKKLTYAYEELNTKHGQLTADYEKLNSEKEEFLKKQQEIEDTLKAERAKAQELTVALKQEQSGKGMMEEELNRIKLDYQKLSQELEVIRQKYQDLQVTSPTGKGAPEKLKTEIELPPVVVSAGTTEPGKVLVINRDFNFVVVDRGLQEGIARSEFLFIARDGKPVARVQAEKVYDHFSACAIVEESRSNPIHEGDQVSKS
jgi:ABC-type Na+ efflux pump permease subunit